MNYLLSIIIPTYNCGAFIKDTLNQISDILPENCELVLVDDGSEDNTAELITEFAKGHSNITVSCNEHKGVSGARNAGIENASGKYITFVDCDDCVAADFLEKSLPLTESDADLYIFGIERIPLEGNHEFWTLKDNEYPSASEFADEYIRVRQLMVYSNCNKFYKKSIIDKMHIRFDESTSFGEDRLFNYAYIPHCGRIVTSSLIMLQYLQRSTVSGSSKHIPEFFRLVLSLHEAKMDCFLNLSKGTTDLEKSSFKAYDLTREIENTISRFPNHPEEKEENLSLINSAIFGPPCDMDKPVDIMIILGSKNCGYKIETALSLLKNNPDMRFLVSGGNMYKDEIQTEAEFMESFLLENGVPADRIFKENRAICTVDNINFSSTMVDMMRKSAEFPCERIGILTSAFHIPRTRYLCETLGVFNDYEISYFSSFGSMTAPDNWYQNPAGRLIVLSEVSKLIKMYFR